MICSSEKKMKARGEVIFHPKSLIQGIILKITAVTGTSSRNWN